MQAIVLVDAIGQPLFSGASILARQPLALVVEEDDVDAAEYLEDDDVCPETQRSGVFARAHQERAIEVAVAW